MTGIGHWLLSAAIMLVATQAPAPAADTQTATPADTPAVKPAAPPEAKSAGKPAAAPDGGRIPLATFAKIPFIEDPSLSPNGERLAGLFGVEGAQVVGVKSLFGSDKFLGFQLPDGTQARWLRWVNDENVIVGLDCLLKVENEYWYVSRLLAINTQTRKLTRPLWDLQGQNGSDVLWTASDGSPDILLAAQNSIYLGPDFWPTVYRVNVETGRKVRVVDGRTGVNDWSADDRGNVRTGVSFNDSSRMFRLLYRAGGDGAFKQIDTANTRKRQVLRRPFLFIPGTTRALVMHDDDKGRSGIYETDLITQADARTVFEMPAGRSEVDYPLLSDDRATLLGVATTRPDRAIHWIDPALVALQAQFDKAVPGSRARIVSFSKDRNRMLVMVGAPDTPGRLYYYDVAGGSLQRIADINAGIGGRRLAPVKLITYRSRDGVEIEGVLTLPRGRDPRNLPFVVMPHGGPWGQDRLDYDYWAQFLASKGYGVLQPNFRGSTGYGTEFLHKGEGQMGLAMQDDIADALGWVVGEGIADPRRVCIAGASYGGYAAMWGVVRDPGLYRCAISIAGVSSLRREVNDFGRSLMGGKYKDDWARMTPDFDAVSPFNAADRITTPLLLIHGKKDVTVDISQSQRMYARMQRAGKTVQYLALPEADHYFTRQQDRIALLSAMEAFLDRHNPADPPAVH